MGAAATYPIIFIGACCTKTPEQLRDLVLGPLWAVYFSVIFLQKSVLWDVKKGFFEKKVYF